MALIRFQRAKPVFWVGFGLLVCLSLFMQPAAANTAASEWLKAQLQSNGSYAKSSDIATPLQATAETLRALETLDPSGFHADSASLNFLTTANGKETTEYLARTVIAHVEAGQPAIDVVAALEAKQNADGGFGSALGYSSNVLDTAFAIEALVKSTTSHANIVAAGVSYLETHQNADGSFTLGNAQKDLSYTTASALMAMHASRWYYNLTQPIAKAVSYLLSSRDASSAWGSDFETAWALIALSSATSDTTPLAAAGQKLAGWQLADGSWGQDVYRTAVATRALHLLQTKSGGSPFNGHGILMGQVSHADGGQPIAGASIVLSGAEDAAATTDATGAYRLQVPSGSYSLAVSAPQFHDLSTPITVASGQTLTFSPGLIRSENPLPNSVSLKAVFVDAYSGAPLAGVKATLNNGNDTSVSSNAHGEFSFAGLSAGDWEMDISRAGYQGLRLIVVLPIGSTNLGTIPLKPLTGSTNDGIVTGFVTDAEHHQPIAGANVTLTGNTTVTATTNALGFYRIVAPPGNIVLTASASGFLQVTGSATLNAGTTLTFSPALLSESSTPPTEATVLGMVQDASTGQPLAGVELKLLDSVMNAVTDANGYFTLPGLAPGQWQLQLNLAGYSTMVLGMTVPGGTSDLGTIRLTSIGSDGSTLVGVVSDSVTGMPLIGATVAIDSEGKSVRTAADGSYRIEGIEPSDFMVKVSATGYISQQGRILLPQAGVFTMNAALQRASAADFDIESLVSEHASYPAYGEVEVEVQLVNRSAIERKVRLYGLIVDESGRIIEQFPAHAVPLGGDIAATLATVPAEGSADSDMEWYNGAHAPGHYEFIVQAFDGSSGQLLAERSVAFEILPTQAIGGLVEFDPPIAQLAAQKPINLKALVSNRGNLDLGSGKVTAKVTLKNSGYQNSNSLLEIETLVQGNGLNRPFGIDRDNAGNLYVANSSGGNLLRVDASGVVSVFAANVSSPVDVDVAPNGDIYVLSSSSSFERFPAEGGRQKIITNLSSQRAIEVLADGKIYIAAASNGVYNVAMTGSKSKLPLTGLGSAVEIQSDNQGRLYVGDATNNTIVRLTATNTLETVHSNLPTLETFAIAEDGSMAAVYGLKKLAFFAPDGTRREITSNLPTTVRGIAWDRDRRILLSVDGPNSLLKLYPTTPDGSVVPGDSVYTRTVSLPALPLDRAAVSLNLGSWTPTLSGDLQVELTVDNHPEYGSLFNTLHIGPNAQGAFEVEKTLVAPGDSANTATIRLFGNDSTSITRIDPSGTTLTAATKTNGRGIAADTEGNLYATNASTTASLVRISPSGMVTTFVSGYKFGDGLVIDNHNNLFTFATTSDATILKISPSGQVTAFATLSDSIQGLAIGPDEKLYAVDDSYTLSRIDSDGRVEVVIRSGFTSPRGLTIDANGYFYILSSTSLSYRDDDGISRSYHKIIRVSPDGKRYSDYYTHAGFEFEGINITADCSNNLLYAPIRDYPFKLSGEEDVLMQIVGDTGEKRQVLYGPAIDPAMSDMDVLYYDRFGQRLLIWTDLNYGKIFSFPIICGSIDADVHLKTRSDVDVSSPNPSPDLTTILGDGRFEHVWHLKQVDNRGVDLQFGLLMKDLTENETRPVAEEAFVEFHNSFVPGQQVRTPLKIPTVLATAAIQISPTLDTSQYGPLSPVNIQVNVNNGSDQPFSGELQLRISDDAGFPVQDLPAISIDGQAGNSMVFYPAQWHTGLFLAGDYQLAATLFDSNGVAVASGWVDFAIVLDPQTPELDATLSPDKLMYAGWDQVILSGRLVNTSANSILSATEVSIQASMPNGEVLTTETINIGELVPGAGSELNFTVPLPDVPSGEYPVLLTVREDDTGNVLLTRTIHFTVVHELIQGLTGTVTATPVSVSPGEPVHCTETATYRSATAAAVKLNSRLINLDSGQLLDDSTRTVTLSQGQTDTHERTIATANLVAGAYACLISGEIDGSSRQLAAAGFEVKVPPIRIDAQLRAGDRGRLLVLLDKEAEPCRGVSRLDLESGISMPLIGAARAEVKLYSTDGTLLDSESALLDARNVNKNGKTLTVGLSIDDFSSDHLSVVVNAPQGLSSALSVSAKITDGEMNLTKTSGTIVAACPSPVTVGNFYGDYRLTAVQRLAATDDPLALTHTPSLTVQRSFLEHLLTEAGWSYTIVNDEAHFAEQLHSGGYVAYLLQSAQVKLDEPLQKELREAVYRGEGLVEAGGHDQRQGRIDEILGVKALGKNAHIGGVTVRATAVHSPGTAAFTVSDKPPKASLAGAEPLAWYQGTEDIAMTTRAYGGGRAEYLGFDLLAEAAMPGADPFYAALLLEALEHVHPETLRPLPGGVFPLDLHLGNQGVAVSGQAVLSLPAGVTVFHPGTATVTNHALIWPFELLPQQSRQFGAWLSLPDEPVQLSALIQTGQSPLFSDYGTAVLNLTPAQSPTLADIRLAVEVLDPEMNKHVLKYLDWALQDQQAGNSAGALAALIRASDALIDLGPHADADLRTAIAEAMRAMARTL